MAGLRTGEWTLSELPGGRKADAEVRKVRRLVARFERSRGLLKPSISPSQMLRMISLVEDIHDAMSRVYSHASLSYAADTQSESAGARVAAMTRLSAQVANDMLFFDQWWKVDLDARNAQRLLAHLGPLAGHFAYMRLMARHTLPEAQERIINIMDVTGSSALVRLYDRLTSAFEYRVGRKTMGREELGALVRSPRASGSTRRIPRASLKVCV